MIRKNGKLEKATWEETYDSLLHPLEEINEQHRPDALAGISSSRCTNEEN
jgi:formate dehydrogenase major subunit